MNLALKPNVLIRLYQSKLESRYNNKRKKELKLMLERPKEKRKLLHLEEGLESKKLKKKKKKKRKKNLLEKILKHQNDAIDLMFVV